MKKFTFLFLMLLVSCKSTPVVPIIETLPPSPEATIMEPVPTSINTFQFNDQCQHLCWMTINPGVTTIQNAKTIVDNSNQIDQKALQASDKEIFAIWHTDPINSFPSHVPVHVEIKFENGVVKTISFAPLPFRIIDFTNLLGQPDKISITLMRVAEGEEVIYAIYFSSQKIMIQVSPGGWMGPDLNDHIFAIELNTEFNKADLPSWWGPIQSWHGYGHIRDYLPGVEIPPYDAIP